MQACKDCDKGYKCPRDNMTAPEPCREGTYQDERSKSSCKPCPTGMYMDGIGATACRECQSGKYAPSPGGAEKCQECVPGKYAAGPASVFCTACSGENEYQPQYGKDACLQCPEGYQFKTVGERVANASGYDQVCTVSLHSVTCVTNKAPLSWNVYKYIEVLSPVSGAGRGRVHHLPGRDLRCFSRLARMHVLWDWLVQPIPGAVFLPAMPEQQDHAQHRFNIREPVHLP